MRFFQKFAVLVALVAPIGASAGTITYNAASDFSISNGNSNGVWSYGYGTFVSSVSNPLVGVLNFTKFTTTGTNFSDASGGYGFNYWSVATNGFPVVGHNPDSTVGISHGTVNVPAAQLFMHPSSTGQDAIVLFTVPTTGLYTIAGSFTRDDQTSNGDGTRDRIFYDSAVTMFDDVNSTTTPNLSFPFSSVGSVQLTAGDTLAFDVNYNTNYASDSTGLLLNITGPTATPEPSSLALLGTGVLGLAGVARRKLRRA